MNVIDEIRERLRKYPDVLYQSDDSHITIRAQDPEGFDVSLEVGPGGYTVSFDGWHEEFTSEEEALNCVALGLSTMCRLQVVYYGSSPVRWTVEVYKEGEWHPHSRTGLLFVPFWRRRHSVHKCNRVIQAGVAPEE